MSKRIIDERTAIEYELVGDYYLPCFKVPDSSPIGKYGRMKRRNLKEHRRVFYFQLVTTCKLFDHITEIDQSVNDITKWLVKQMSEREGVTEVPKAADMMAWVGLMINIRNRVEEIVTSDLVYA